MTRNSKMVRILSLVFILVTLCSICFIPAEAATYIKRGSRGNEVKYLQWDLNMLNFNCGTADGIAGAKFDSAVRNYQRSRGLAVDGIVGPASKNAIYDEVRQIQNQLKSKGYNPGTVDGIAGSNTQNALKSFQRNNGLTADGICGPKTKAVLFQSNQTNSSGTLRQKYAKQILNNSKIVLAKAHPSGVRDNAFAYNNVLDTANGKAASRSSYGNAPGGSVYLDADLLKIILDLQAKYGTVYVSEICGASHSKNSLHYRGIAVDITNVGGSVSVQRGKDIYNYLTSRGYSLKTVYSGTVREDSSHYHIALNK